MAWCPFAVHRPLPENNTEPRIVPKAVIAHSAGSTGSLYGYWLNGTNLESHFWISWRGKIEQYMDTERQADANGEANSFAISIETDSTRYATEGWSKEQKDALIKLIDWCCDTHGIPREQMEDKTDPGLGWHIMFGAPGPWTPARGKVCPGPRRIVEFRQEIIPTVSWMGMDEQEDEDMPFTDDDRKKLNYVYDQFSKSVPDKQDSQGYPTKAGTHRWRQTTILKRLADLTTGRRPE